ncbi:MAG: endonuclease [Proteobacteria bacterium]|uniref:Endonuclease n=1 Tax=Candidatus Avisuccinivibrio stercorigallinarum TaxID=2840704 RepID=A0A9D9DA70_9GAMM|nr:endonuclease [Candidatus Avisuccinivibrio stercorigallinarum]
MKNIIAQRPRQPLLRALRKTMAAGAAALILALPGADALAVDSFNQAKKILPSIYKQLDDPATIYCGCPVTIERNRFKLSLKECGYQVRKQPKRAARVEIEHVMPAWEFGHQLQCWQDGGRKNCAKDDRFKEMEGDLHNLFPSVGEVNGDRSNFQFTDWNGTPTQYGKCEMVIDFKQKQAQPPRRSRGVIARAYLYMADKYGIRLSNTQKRIYEAWNRQYQPDDNECLRNQLIEDVQGNDNPFVTKACALVNKD